MEQITLANPQDLHLHLRGDLQNPNSQANEIMKIVTPFTQKFSRILAMPNVMPNHIKNTTEALEYMKMVGEAMLENQNTDVIYTISLKPETTPETIIEAKNVGVKAVKYYPGGVTTNSGETSGDLDINNPKTREVLETMQEEGIVLSLHPETTLKQNEYGQITKGFVHNAEREFKNIIEQIAKEFPNLKIVVEHISTEENAKLLASEKYTNVYGTITPQHLMLTAHDKEGGHGFNTHLHCKPTLKTPKDQEAIWKLILSGNKKVFLGSDSAPHPIDKKEAEHCAAGVFSSPIVLELITNWFFDPKTIKFGIDNGLLPENGYLNKLQELLQNFVGTNGNQVYGNLDEQFYKTVILKKQDFQIPESYGDNPIIKPMWAGKTLNYKVSKIINS